MFMRMVYDEKLAQAAYVIGCPRSGEAVVVDPERDVDRYVDVARANGLRITTVAETHIHADFVSGARELAELGATVCVSGEGGPEWSTRWLGTGPGGKPYRHRVVRDGDTIALGGVELRVVHTPGHTPEHVCYVVTDRGSDASEPMGILTGDFVFVGDVGRPDLLESAVGETGAGPPAARELFRSLRRFVELPDFVQVWPAHGAGSACGKALGAVPQSTVGYEKRRNAALRRAGGGEERAFVDFVLSGQPEPPVYFARMKQLNRDGPPVLGKLPRPRRLSPGDLGAIDTRSGALVDTRTWNQFKAGHVPGSLYLPLGASFSTDAGSFVRPEESITLLVDAGRLDEAVRALVRVGLDRVAGWAEQDAVAEYARAGGRLETAVDVEAGAALDQLRSGAFGLDVRRNAEFAAGHPAGTRNVPHTRLAQHLEQVPRSGRVIVSCQSGGRSARSVAYLRRLGYDAVNLAGGFGAWQGAGLPVER